jgi:hypothetical protein
MLLCREEILPPWLSKELVIIYYNMNGNGMSEQFIVGPTIVGLVDLVLLR